MLKVYNKLSILLLGMLIIGNAHAWQHEISGGYGYSKELGYSEHHYGAFINFKWHKFPKIDKTLIFTIDSSFGSWNATTPENNKLNTIALSGALRAYFATPEQLKYRPYLLASFGPTFMSTEDFGAQKQGANFSFQTTMGGGMEIMTDQVNQRGVDFNIRMIHYCNAGLASPNEGFDIFFVFSVGYLF